MVWNEFITESFSHEGVGGGGGNVLGLLAAFHMGSVQHPIGDSPTAPRVDLFVANSVLCTSRSCND